MQRATWKAHRASLLARIAEAEDLAERELPEQAEQARQKLEQAYRTLQEAQAAHDSARRKFELIGERIRAKKREAAELAAELKLHDEQEPRPLIDRKPQTQT